jgi:hypothetical protein
VDLRRVHELAQIGNQQLAIGNKFRSPVEDEAHQ